MPLSEYCLLLVYTNFFLIIWLLRKFALNLSGPKIVSKCVYLCVNHVSCQDQIYCLWKTEVSWHYTYIKNFWQSLWKHPHKTNTHTWVKSLQAQAKDIRKGKMLTKLEIWWWEIDLKMILVSIAERMSCVKCKKYPEAENLDQEELSC